jgi:two-component system chemotaxis response regulator CheB
MDMVLGTTSGLSATERIMADCPTPILVISASLNRGEVFRTYDALAAGAVDVLEKPQASVPDHEWRDELHARLSIASRIRVVTRRRARAALASETVAPPFDGDADVPSTLERRRLERLELVVIGASTGGPAALREILRELPAAFPLPILLVLHISKAFGAGFAQWLDAQIELPVAIASDGIAIPKRGKGVVIMAPPDQHLVVRNRQLRLSDDPERHSCRPSVDALFDSVAAGIGSGAIACLLTGMGRDGAEGLAAIRRAGGITLAQDQATSVVFGMPDAAIRLGAAQRVLPLGEFAGALRTLAGVDCGVGWPPR